MDEEAMRFMAMMGKTDIGENETLFTLKNLERLMRRSDRESATTIKRWARMAGVPFEGSRGQVYDIRHIGQKLKDRYARCLPALTAFDTSGAGMPGMEGGELRADLVAGGGRDAESQHRGVMLKSAARHSR